MFTKTHQLNPKSKSPKSPIKNLSNHLHQSLPQQLLSKNPPHIQLDNNELQIVNTKTVVIWASYTQLQPLPFYPVRIA